MTPSNYLESLEVGDKVEVVTRFGGRQFSVPLASTITKVQKNYVYIGERCYNRATGIEVKTKSVFKREIVTPT